MACIYVLALLYKAHIRAKLITLSSHALESHVAMITSVLLSVYMSCIETHNYFCFVLWAACRFAKEK